MSKIIKSQLDNGSIIYFEASDDVDIPRASAEEPLVAKGGDSTRVANAFKSVEQTMRAFTEQTVKAFEGVATANIDKLTLEFGVKVGGEAGIPYITKGTMDSSLKVTVECSFPKS